MTITDPDAEARRALRRHRAFATALLVLMAALTLGSYALPARLRDRPAAGRRQGRLRRRHRRLVRGDRPVPPSARHPDPAHRHHPAPEGAARRRRSAASSPPMCSPAARSRACSRGSICRASCTASWPIPPPRGPPPWRSRHAAAAAGDAWRTAARGGSSPASCRASSAAPAPAGWSRGRCTAWSKAAATRRCSASSSASSKTLLAEQGGSAARRDRGAGARAGRPAGRLGAGRLDRAPRAGDGERRTGQDEPRRLRAARRIRRMGAARDHPHGGRPGARRRDRRGDPPGGGARDGAGLAVGRLGAAAAGAGSRRRQAVRAAPSPISKARWPISAPCWRPTRRRARGSTRGGERGRRLLPAAQAQLVRLHRPGGRRLGHRRRSSTGWSCGSARTCNTCG